MAISHSFSIQGSNTFFSSVHRDDEGSDVDDEDKEETDEDEDEAGSTSASKNVTAAVDEVLQMLANVRFEPSS